MNTPPVKQPNREGTSRSIPRFKSQFAQQRDEAGVFSQGVERRFTTDEVQPGRALVVSAFQSANCSVAIPCRSMQSGNLHNGVGGCQVTALPQINSRTPVSLAASPLESCVEFLRLINALRIPERNTPVPEGA